MATSRPRTAALCLALATAGCTGAPPPSELDGLWSAGDASCEAGVGVRFGADRIEAVYDRQHETLFERPDYHVLERGEDFRVRIDYRLPRLPGGAQSSGAYGVLVLAREGGWLMPEAHQMRDTRTGAVRTRIGDDPIEALLTLTPCATTHPWRAGLRGRTGA